MTINLSETFANAKNEFINAVNNGEPQERQNELYGDMINQLFEETKLQAKAEAERVSSLPKSAQSLSANQRSFFMDINKNVNYKEEKLLPEETIDRIFEDLTTNHPLLADLGTKNAGLRLKFLKSETSGVAVWGKIYGEIKGQLDAAFSEETAIQNKLTAFVVLPKDLNDFGPAWIERFVRVQIEEAFAVALETAFLKGTGKDQPIGLNRQVQKGVSVTEGAYPEKEEQGTLTFANPRATVNELTQVFKYHSTNEKGKSVAVKGNVTMVVNPSDAFEVQAQYTHLNANGVYVTALPFNLNVIESTVQEAGKVLTYVKGLYDGYLAGGINVQKFKETLALDDMDLYTAKQFAYGKAKDNKVAAVWKLDLKGHKPALEGTEETL
ncbi:phage major capsid protein [Staphylococcus aureus]|uniref:phage major capsid protein n=1 Tax=Staphylococcus aureus TaxID=1280 RepID=UPI000F43E3F1|nr:phage major capsid protein [Staphylococcus aureus]MBF0831128.1 phage major capsid protein [Staphylococcus aureus]HDD0393474.1 phage major capsid protein [Staphylococcus aureus]HDD0584848.1 phage major capsid protein [Staphylococcus aureus]HDD0743076.1 phage major capsid protein [Staphylococcus aureus]